MLMMKLTHTIVILVGLAVHFYDLLTDILYIQGTSFHNQHLYRAAITFVILSPLLQAALTVSGLYSIYRVKSNSDEYDFSYFKVKAVAAVVLCALGLFDVLFLIVVCTVKSRKVIDTFFSLSKAFAFISAFCESIPQIVVTMLNNYYNNTWTALGIASLCGSSASALYDALSCISAFDNLSRVRPQEDEEFSFTSPRGLNTPDESREDEGQGS
jgi:hypothetical protein